MKVLLAMVLVLATTAIALPSYRDFKQAKHILDTQVFIGELRKDYYCGCTFEKTKMNWASCGYKPRMSAVRGSRLEWDHVVPVSIYGRNLKCWDKGGRENCTKTSKKFQKFEGDMHNLLPAVGELNADKSDKTFGEISEDGDKEYGACEFMVRKGLVLPPPGVRGDLARIVLYISDKYKLVLQDESRALMKKWSRADPVSASEREINRRIKALQGDSNPLVEK